MTWFGVITLSQGIFAVGYFKNHVMRKVILSVAVSLDGFIEGPNGEYDWCFTDQDYGMSGFFQTDRQYVYWQKIIRIDADDGRRGYARLSKTY